MASGTPFSGSTQPLNQQARLDTTTSLSGPAHSLVPPSLCIPVAKIDPSPPDGPDAVPPLDHQQFRLQNPTFTGSGSFATIEESVVESLSVPLQRQLSTAERWKIILDTAVKGIVSIKYTALRTFDRVFPGSYAATGFIVDRTRGIILSNRHVVTPGPTTASALFSKYEEVFLEPIYFDPIHDFGFFKFDPTKIKFAEFEQIELYPEGAKVGLDIKVCGNDAGEQQSILGSTLARLDRPAPPGDWNTFYYQAASGTSGGSSGSPVLDISGRAVALVSGGSVGTASSFYLPLDRVVRALKLIQEGLPVSRGTLLTEFVHLPYDELKKLGLPEDIERDCRRCNNNGTGLLTVRGGGVVPEGPGAIAGLEVGDIVLECYRPPFAPRYVDTFYALSDIIDESVDEVIRLTVCRGTERKTIDVKVKDLNSVIPDTFLEVEEAIIHPLSYQIARSNNLPCKGLYIATPGIFTRAHGSLITQLDGKDVNSLEGLIEILRSIPDRKNVSFRFRRIGGWEEEFDVCTIDHHFFPMTLFKRNAGVWERNVITPNPVGVVELKRTLEVGIEATWSEKLKASLVVIDCRIPYPVHVISHSA